MRTACLAFLSLVAALHKRTPQHMMDVQQQYKVCSGEADCGTGYTCAPADAGAIFNLCQRTPDVAIVLTPRNASSAAKAPRAASWLVLQNPLVTGKTIKSVPNVTLLDECTTLCAVEPKCYAVAFNTSSWPASTCELKPSPLTLSTNATTFLSATMYPASYTCTAHATYAGRDTFNASGNLQDCFNICNSRASTCNAFSWAIDPTPGTVLGRCYMKTVPSGAEAVLTDATWVTCKRAA
ncbi:hypothetical protein SPRG_10313 [Saprolegnia parasitica CBS 223.65]|uniref:Apple domain-containing protein n=1 Tax=Saprolegnia parasitica (strain CBS 223.65) TaxID=695850 RepID=A0A067CCE3_SAPPC|nr:hypothetical protein SPRG_10313 [Saprolegnia parasitica CBS 223.65]KDO24497.1 hypothetical protein SPRG_10313 [Saprolegnia parasitica CBS 223.65]|eukprot:XP_012204763.1 hypothetical protein SPRG_10313 [Saprolegnia parasitica CBS 223.65]